MAGSEGISRREALKRLAGLAAAFVGSPVKSMEGIDARSMLRRAVPSTGELLPAVGLGTWKTFDVGPLEAERAPVREVLQSFHALGGRVVDSSPMYGRAEATVGALAVELGLKDLFVATKVWPEGQEAGERQIETSFARLRETRLDLLQIHNLVDWRVHIKTLRALKEEGRVRYIGATHYTASAHDELARVLAAEPLDFIQVNYSLASTEAEERLLPLAAERGAAVLVNRPFEEGALFRAVRGKALPDWAAAFGAGTWAQFFLKFILSHAAVTGVLPATANPAHLKDNMRAGLGPLPDETARRRMREFIRDL